MSAFTIVDTERAVPVEGRVAGDRVLLDPAALKDGLGWEIHDGQLCSDVMCIPLADERALVHDGGVDLHALAGALDRPLALDVAEGAAFLGSSARERSQVLAARQAPDFALPDLDGRLHTLREHRGKKVLLVAWASWCGCRLDLPVWQVVHEELKGRGFAVIAVALDKNADDPRPWIEAARPTHPSLVDAQHTLADLYNIVNVPTIFWIDERGRIVRPNDVAFGSDTFKHITGLSASGHLGALRAWVKGEAPALSDEEVKRQQPLPTAADQQARAEFGLGQWLWAQGRQAAAERHFARAGELAPHDFTIRRGTMPMRGIDSMGPQFREMLQTWVGAGQPFYRPLPDTAGRPGGAS